ncbi:MAG: hypothetical protein JEY99_04450 [Spirochaetales bacterium]|nr:hypothetical protein [Spirochaetales bacterium]
MSFLFFFGCASQNNLVIESIKSNSFTEIEGKTVTLSPVVFDDWAYPSLEKMEELFPDNPEFREFAFEGEKYHGVKIMLADEENMTYTYDETDDTYLYDAPDIYKVIAFFPRNNERLVKLFKKLYVSKRDIRLRGQFLYVLPGSVWTDTQVLEEDMPVLMVKSVLKLF